MTRRAVHAAAAGRSRRAVAALLLASAVVTAGRAHDAPAALPFVVELRGTRVVATLDLAPALPPSLQRLLSNGLTNVIALHVALEPDRGGDPVALFAREVDVLYDVWEETWGVTVKDAGQAWRTLTFRRFDELRAFLADARDLDLGPAAELGGGRWVLQTRVEVNPVSKELLERTREFIANPTAAGRGVPSRSILGAMASYLLRGADPGADVHQFRTPPFTAHDLVRR